MYFCQEHSSRVVPRVLILQLVYTTQVDSSRPKNRLNTHKIEKLFWLSAVSQSGIRFYQLGYLKDSNAAAHSVDALVLGCFHLY